MRFPDRPTCHEDIDLVAHALATLHAPGAPPPEPPGATWRDGVCSECGSVHPEKLLALFASGATIGGTDGTIANPLKSYIVLVYANDRHSETIAEWHYNHLRDVGLDEEARVALFAALAAHGGIGTRVPVAQ